MHIEELHLWSSIWKDRIRSALRIVQDLCLPCALIQFDIVYTCLSVGEGIRLFNDILRRNELKDARRIDIKIPSIFFAQTGHLSFTK